MPNGKHTGDGRARAALETTGGRPESPEGKPPMPMRLAGLALVILAAAVVWAACTGGNGSSIRVTVEPGRVSCEAFRQFKSYRFKTEVILDLAERDPSVDPDATDPYGPDAFKFTQTIEGAVQHDDKIQATITSVDVESSETPSETPIVVVDDIAWTLVGGIWQGTSLEGGPLPIPYFPEATCNAIAPDIYVGDLTGEPEMLGDIPSQKYHFDALSSDLPDRHPSFGPQSDVARFVNEYVGDIWIADEGKYITKLDITGTGTYDNGRQLTMSIFLELSDIDDDSIRIEAPQ